jgi:hypothetical protein
VIVARGGESMQGSTALGPPHERASDEARMRVIAPVNDSFTNVLYLD